MSSIGLLLAWLAFWLLPVMAVFPDSETGGSSIEAREDRLVVGECLELNRMFSLECGEGETAIYLGERGWFCVKGSEVSADGGRGTAE